MENLELDFENGRMWVSPKSRKVFQPNESIGLPEEMIVTMPNLPMLVRKGYFHSIHMILGIILYLLLCTNEVCLFGV